jgi:riboflavin biosynthesis pyrimidine reductase
MRRLLPDPSELDDGGLIDAYRLPAGRHLRVNFVTSLDGAVTVDGRSDGLGSPGDLQIFRILRALADVVLVGHGTAAVEG